MATQPGTGLAVFDPKGAMPAHLQNFFDEVGSNITPRTTTPSLSPEGKVWSISIEGNKTPLQRRNVDGDLEPMPIMKAIILDYAEKRGRSYYEGEYDPKNVSMPICWSDDGVAPDASLPGPFAAGTTVEPGASRKISATCANCPMAVKGSKVTAQGKSVAACGEHRMVAVLPDPALGLPTAMQVPLRLKLAVTSDWDKQSPDQEANGWLAFRNYVEWLVARGCKHTAGIVTKMKFDPDAAYPKIFFASERPLDIAEMTAIKPLLHSDEVKRLLGGTWTPAGVDGIPKDQQVVAAVEPTAEVAIVADSAALVAATPEVATPAGYRMADGEQFTYDQYKTSGWTDQVLIAHGKLIAVAAPAAVEPVVIAEPAAPAAPVQEAVVVGEPAATAVAPTATPAVASQPAAEVVVVGEPQTSAPSQPAAPAPVQQPAQAAAPAPAPAPAAPEPQAAAAVAAGVTPQVSTDVPAELVDIMKDWA